MKRPPSVPCVDEPTLLILCDSIAITEDAIACVCMRRCAFFYKVHLWTGCTHGYMHAWRSPSLAMDAGFEMFLESGPGCNNQG